MNYTIDPELLFLKWAYRKGLLDDDALCEFNRRAFADEELESYLDALVAWNYMTREEVDRLLDPEEIARGVAEGLIDEKLAASLKLLIDD